MARTRDEEQDMLTYAQVAKLLQVSERTIKRLVASGRLKSSRVGRQRRFARADVEAYLESSKS